MGNFFAYLMLTIWPFIGVQIKKRLPLDKAAVCIFLIPYLLLPVALPIDFPVLPPFDKTSIASLTAFFLFLYGNKNVTYFPRGTIPKLLCVLLFVAPLATIFTNTDALYYGPRTIRGLGLGEYPSMAFRGFSGVYVPFMLGVSFLYSKPAQENLLKVLVFAGLIYSILMLFEVRMSPQLHIWVYGYFPYDFVQQMRAGGFRPVVFLGHGLSVAIFAVTVTIAACFLWRKKIKFATKKDGWLCIYLAVVVVFCKTLGAMIYGAVFIPFVLFLKPKKQIKYLFIVTALIFIYPLLRGADVLPLQEFHDFVEARSPERAQSLGFRLEHEEALLEKARERAAFGWGSWGRPRVYHSVNGKDLSVTDGYWIIIFGIGGWAGYLTIFGFLCYPIYQLYSEAKKRKYEPKDLEVVSCVAVLLIVSLIDTIPNSSMSPFSFVLAGAVLGQAQELKNKRLAPPNG